MRTLAGGNYSAIQLMNLLKAEASLAVDYIDNVILDYEHTSHNSEHFKNVYMFDDIDFPKNPKGDLRKAVRGNTGVYVFIVKSDFSLDNKQIYAYNNNCHGAGFKIYGAKRLMTGQHFYQGSSTSSSLQTRMHQHYSETIDVSALQLNNSNRIIVKDKLKLFIFPVVSSLKKESFFIRMIEAELHKRHPAITGSSRT